MTALKIVACIALSMVSSFVSAWCLIERTNAWWAWPGGIWGVFLTIAFVGFALFLFDESRPA